MGAKQFHGNGETTLGEQEGEGKATAAVDMTQCTVTHESTRAGTQETIWATECQKDIFREYCSRVLSRLPSTSTKPGSI